MLIGIAFVGCVNVENTKPLEEVNSFTKQGKDFFQNYQKNVECDGKENVRIFKVSISHESASNLNNYDLLIKSEGIILYNDKYLKTIQVSMKVCEGSRYVRPYNFDVFLVKNDSLVSSWCRKDILPMSDSFTEMNIVLFQENNFDYTNSYEYDIDFN